VIEKILKWLVIAIVVACVGVIVASYVCFPEGNIDLDERYF